MLLARRAAPRPALSDPAAAFFSAAMGLVHGKDAKSTMTARSMDFVSEDIQGNPVNFKQFEGKVCVITNVASE